MEKVFIYGLIDPRTSKIRYIGKTRDTEKRLRKHINETKRGATNHKHNWIRQLLEQGLIPIIEVLEETTNDDWEEREKEWIAQTDDLTNMTEGGENPPVGLTKGRTLSPETRKKIGEAQKGKKLSPEHKKKFVEAMKKANVGNKRFLGQKHSEETKRKQSEAHKGAKNPNYGREFSKEYRANLSKAQIGRKHSEETKQKMREARKKFYEDPANRQKTEKAAKARWAKERKQKQENNS